MNSLSFCCRCNRAQLTSHLNSILIFTWQKLSVISFYNLSTEKKPSKSVWYIKKRNIESGIWNFEHESVVLCHHGWQIVWFRDGIMWGWFGWWKCLMRSRVRLRARAETTWAPLMRSRSSKTKGTEKTRNGVPRTFLRRSPVSLIGLRVR